MAPPGVQAGDRGRRPTPCPTARALASSRAGCLIHPRWGTPSFASLLLHEGRSVIYVARQLGHDARLALTRYGHVIDELEDTPRLDAEAAIASARLAADTSGPGSVREFGP